MLDFFSFSFSFSAAADDFRFSAPALPLFAAGLPGSTACTACRTASSSLWLGFKSGSSDLAVVARRCAIQVSSVFSSASVSAPGSAVVLPRSGSTASSMRCASSDSSASPSVAALPFKVCNPRARSSNRNRSCAFSSSMR